MTPPALDKLLALLPQALARRASLLAPPFTGAVRVFSGRADGLDGVFIDRYADAATLILYEGAAPPGLDTPESGNALRTALNVRALYLKPFARDRSRLGGELPPCVTDPTPLAGEPQPETTLITENGYTLETRLYDGLSTGLFLDQRANRAWVKSWCQAHPNASVLNTFAYTCAFSVAAASARATTTSVDVSPRYLDWGKRNFTHNNIDVAPHRFARMDTFEFLSYAQRKNLTYDLILLDPPSFASGNKKKGIKPWSSISDYPKLLTQALTRLNRNGVLFASTNTQDLCRPGRLQDLAARALRREPRWLTLPPTPPDFARDTDRFAAIAFSV